MKIQHQLVFQEYMSLELTARVKQVSRNIDRFQLEGSDVRSRQNPRTSSIKTQLVINGYKNRTFCTNWSTRSESGRQICNLTESRFRIGQVQRGYTREAGKEGTGGRAWVAKSSRRPSLPIPCPRQSCFQNSIPIWLPHCPIWMVMISATGTASVGVPSSAASDVFFLPTPRRPLARDAEDQKGLRNAERGKWRRQ